MDDVKYCLENGIPREAIIKERLECAEVLENLVGQINKRPLFDCEERREFITALRYAISELRSR